MHFKLAINSVVRSLFLDASGSVTSLTLICSRIEGDGVWDIGGAHALAHKDESVAKGKRHLSEVEVHIRRRSALTDEQVQRLALAPKIGEMSFYPRKKKTWDLLEFPARLAVCIFLGDLDLDGIVGAVANGEGDVTAIIFLDEHPSLRQYVVAGAHLTFSVTYCNSLQAAPLPPGQLLRQIRPAEQDLKQMNWDEAGWLYQALAAIELARRETPGAPATAEIDQQFAVLANSLRLPREKVADKVFLYRSPKDYDPARVVPLFVGLMDRLGALLRTES